MEEMKRAGRGLEKLSVNQLLIGSLFLSCIIIAFLGGILVSNSKGPSPTVKSESAEFSTSTPTPFPSPVPEAKKEVETVPIPKNTPTPTQETKRKLVPITIEMMNKTYYCYEDKVNELANLDYLVTIDMNIGRGCMDAADNAQRDCSSNCIEDPCFEKCLEDHGDAIQKCIDETPDTGNELLRKIGQYCP